MTPTLFNQTATGTFAALPDLLGAMVSILNNSGSDLEVRRKGVEASDRVFVLSSGQAWSFRHVTNANQLEVKGSGTIYGEVEPT